MYSNYTHVLKAQNRCSQLFLFTQNQRIFHSIIIFHRRILSDHLGINIFDYFQSMTTSGIMLGKDNIFSVNTTFHFPTFEDKGRLHVYHNKIKIDHFRDNPFQARLSEIAMDRDRT